MRTRDLILLGKLSLIWGSAWIFTPLLAQTTAPLAASSLAFALASIGTGLAATILRTPNPINKLPLRTTLTLALTLIAFPSVLITVANQHGAGGWLPLLYALLPLLAALEAWSPAMLIAPGATLVLLGASTPLTLAKLPWAALILTAVALQAFAFRYAGRHLKTIPTKQLLRSLTTQCAIACVALATASAILETPPRLALIVHWAFEPLLGLAYVAIPATAIAYAVLYLLLTRSAAYPNALAPQQLAATQWLQLLIDLAEASAFAHTWPTAQVLAAALVLAACTAAVLLTNPGSNPQDTHIISAV